MAKPKTSKVDSLLAAIQQKAPTSQPSEDAQPPDTSEATAPRKTGKRSAIAPTPKSRVGKPVQFWLHDEDRKLVRELAAWLAGQGLRPTDSMVIRSALRTAKTGGELLTAYRKAAELDGRLKQHKSK
jgi:hypothetical protein